MTAGLRSDPSGTLGALQVAGNDKVTFDTNGNVVVTGNLSLSNTAARITGDFSNATVSSRIMFQTATASGSTTVSVMPGSGGSNAAFAAYAGVDVNNSSVLALSSLTGECRISATVTGSGAYTPLTFVTSAITRMQVDTVGNIHLGRVFTSSPIADKTAGLYVNQSFGTYIYHPTAAGLNVGVGVTTSPLIQFYYNGTTAVGSITTNGTATTYGTTSDYRLKNTIEDANKQAGFDRINQTRVRSYYFNAAPDDMVESGFIAHELQEIIPDAVVGEKDAVNDDGTPKMQTVDYSKLVPDLVLAIQTLTAKVEALEAQLAAN